jgi:hypothetical protein
MYIPNRISNCPDLSNKTVLKKLRFPSFRDNDPYLALLAEGGFMIEKMTKLLFPEGSGLISAALLWSPAN